MTQSLHLLVRAESSGQRGTSSHGDSISTFTILDSPATGCTPGLPHVVVQSVICAKASDSEEWVGTKTPLSLLPKPYTHS